MSRTVRVDHLARVEGHGGITVELDGGAVSRVQFDISEGIRLIEGLIRGRSFEDVSQIVSRICAICSVAHSLTSLKATEHAFGISVSPQTEALRDLMYRGENIESHALHLFLLAIPDYLDYPSAIAMAADDAEAVKLGLRLKRMGNSIQEIVGGRAIHPVNARLGGFGRIPSTDQLVGLRNELQQCLGSRKAMIDLLVSLPSADFCRTATAFAALRFPKDYGYYLGDEIDVLWNGTEESVHAGDYRCLANEIAVPHSHAKHSSFNGRPFMVGALARLSVNWNKLTGLAADAAKGLGLSPPFNNPMDNNKAQAVELVLDLEHALKTVEDMLSTGLKEEGPAKVRPRAGTATAVTEAPRGLLFHSYTYDSDGRITAADVITPTALNASSVEHHFRKAVEQDGDKEALGLKKKLEMIARAYDPCISCSVHLMTRSHVD